MNKNLPSIKQSTQATLTKSSSLLNITKKILTRKTPVVPEVIEEWILAVWEWADVNSVSQIAIPRDKRKFIDLNSLDFINLNLKTIPKELCFLENITSINVWDNNLKKLPKEIINFVNLQKLNLRGNPLVLTKNQNIWIEQLKEEGCVVYMDTQIVDRENRNIQIKPNKKTTPTIKKTTELKTAVKITDDPNRVIEFEDNIKAWIDKDTGLMWEVKTKEKINYEYAWSENDVEEAWSPEFLKDDVKDAFSYAEKLNTQKYAGFNDWRVPTKEELETILTEEIIDNYYMKPPLSRTSSHGYWSSTSSKEDFGDCAWLVDFDYGGVYDYLKRSSVYVRCVRDGQ